MSTNSGSGSSGGAGGARGRRKRGGSSRPPRRQRLTRVEETSAGGLVLRIEDGQAWAALIGRLDRRKRLIWSMPKGHVEEGETAEQAAVREASEETGILSRVIAPLGSVVNCQYPATVGASPVNMGIQVMEAVLEALSRARPDRASAKISSMSGTRGGKLVRAPTGVRATLGRSSRPAM